MFEKDHHITHEWWGAYLRHNTLFRRIYSGKGAAPEEEFIAENHAIMMYDPLIEG